MGDFAWPGIVQEKEMFEENDGGFDWASMKEPG